LTHPFAALPEQMGQTGERAAMGEAAAVSHRLRFSPLRLPVAIEVSP
jgi:hypothetical protein